MLATDVMAVTSIAGCAALSAGVTAGLLSSSDHSHHDSRCEIVVEDHVSGLTVSHDGQVIVMAPANIGDLQEIVLRADGDAEKCRRKRRRHRHRGDIERTRNIVRALERAEGAQERIEWARVRAMERRLEMESQAMEQAARSLESIMESEVQDRLDAEVGRMDFIRSMEMRDLESRERFRRRVRR